MIVHTRKAEHVPGERLIAGDDWFSEVRFRRGEDFGGAQVRAGHKYCFATRRAADVADRLKD